MASDCESRLTILLMAVKVVLEDADMFPECEACDHIEMLRCVSRIIADDNGSLGQATDLIRQAQSERAERLRRSRAANRRHQTF